MKKVLMVEDDHKLTIAMGIRLKAMGYDVSTAGDAVSAVAAARKYEPDMVLIDINLPGGDGFMVAERLQMLVQTAMIPFIFITASKEPGLKEKAIEMGAVAFLEKPFDASDLVDAIEGSYYAAASM
ncbi:MAG: response regulator transcription factor [Halioglobus sp.]